MNLILLAELLRLRRLHLEAAIAQATEAHDKAVDE